MRAEYAALTAGLPALAAEFGCTIGDLELVAAFTSAMERVDRELDAIVAAVDRAAFADRVTASLQGAAAPLVELAAFNRVLVRSPAASRVTELVAETLANTEQLRRTTDRREYVARVEREGALVVEMMLALLGDDANAAFAAFLRAIAAPANLLDKLLDARARWPRIPRRGASRGGASAGSRR
ncbi:MAG TPA: hypothetical protein VMJ10_26660 [Kofleriaceae bacterium]|nr:hypothetical protein [Kofleriaceae bacterium]